ncbi:MAG: hemerythrin domain-containing protein [Deltaproteobacteria bacterium]|nr:hemerythrin domain-containing protein [Deltaproteobacteria bacterium]
MDAVFRPVFSLLGAHHRRLDEVFVRVQKSAADREFPIARETFRRFSLELRVHIDIEEHDLFPLFEKATGMMQGPTTVMRMEHQQIHGLLDEISALLGRGDDISLAARRLLTVLTAHNQKEENILYPMSDQRIARPELEALEKTIQAKLNAAMK